MPVDCLCEPQLFLSYFGTVSAGVPHSPTATVSGVGAVDTGLSCLSGQPRLMSPWQGIPI